MARDRLLDGALVLNDLHLANRIRDAGAEWVLVREYDLEWQPALTGTASDIEVGWDWWRGRRWRYAALDHRCYIQPLNEQNHPTDGYFYRGLCEAARDDGHHLAIFADSHGNPAGSNFKTTWQLRVSSDCMKTAKSGGHIYCYHAYGALDPKTEKETDQPGSAVYFDGAGHLLAKDDTAWTYYGGRHLLAYESFVPEDQRIPVVFGEAGPSDAVFRGAGQVINDLRGFIWRLQGDPYVKCICYWAIGTQEPWGYSNFGPELPQIRDWLRSL